MIGAKIRFSVWLWTRICTAFNCYCHTADSVWLTLVLISSVTSGLTSTTKLSLKPDCQQNSDSRTCHTAVSRHFYLTSETKVQCDSINPLQLRNTLAYLVLTYISNAS